LLGWAIALNASDKPNNEPQRLGLTKFDRKSSGYSVEKLFDAIDGELHAGRFVVVGLLNPGGWHSWVIYDEDTREEVIAISTDRKRTIEERRVKAAILRTQGADFGHYEFPSSPARLPSSPPRFGVPSFTP
jgi:hypothetical protein